MRYLRMFTNAIAGGVLVAMYLVVLVLQLNPHVPIVSTTAWRWFVALLSMYGPYLSVAIYLLLLGREAVGWRRLQPAWFSVRLLAWLGAAGAAAAALVTWANLRGFRAVLSDAAAERMREGAIATTVFAAVLVTIAVLRYSFGRRGSRTTGVLLVVSMVLSVGVPLWLRGPGEPAVPAARRNSQARPLPIPPRVRIIAIDGASLELIRGRVAAGQLPNFGRLLDRGAAINLATLKPTQAEPVWAAAATGKYPPKNGIRSEAFYYVQPDDPDRVHLLPDYCFAYALLYQDFIRNERLTSQALHARTLWDILADYGFASGIVNWPLTRPAVVPIGYLVSDYIDEAASSPLRLSDPEAGDPTTAVDIAREVFDAWLDRPWPDVLPMLATGEQPPQGIVRARWDRAYAEAADMLEQQFVPRLSAVRYEGIDTFGHIYLRAAEPERFGDVGRAAARRSILDRYYGYLDGEVGRAVDRMEAGDLLLVISGYGMAPASIFKRVVGRMLGDPPVLPVDTRPGSHEQAPDGFLLAYGEHVAAGDTDRRGSIVDVAPTVLYYMGVPIGRDMDGFARTDLFRSGYTREHPVVYTATHERGPRGQ